MGPTSGRVDARPTRHAVRAPARLVRGARSAARTLRSCSDGLSVRRVSVRSTSSTSLGSGAGCHGAASAGEEPSSNMIVIRSVADTPSTMQWWTFESSAQRLPRRPSSIQISHSGLSRSRRCAKIRAAVRRSCSSEPGAGRAEWRRW